LFRFNLHGANIRHDIIFILLEKIRGKRRFVGQLRRGMGHSARGANVSHGAAAFLARVSSLLNANRRDRSAAFGR